MATFLIQFTPSPPLIKFPKIHSSSKPDQNMNPVKIPAARDRIIDFGKHKGQMLGTLPSTYLKWVSKNLRAQDFQEWALLADQVLEDPVYNDRVEWEFADKLLNGDVLSSSSIRSEKSAVQDLVEISERFGWDNEDKVGWSKVDFKLLGTSKSGRIPRIVDGGETRKRELKMEVRREKVGEEIGGEREKRRERMKMRRGGGGGGGGGMMDKKKGINGGDGFGVGEEDDRTVVEVYNPFPGRESLLKKVFNK